MMRRSGLAFGMILLASGCGGNAPAPAPGNATSATPQPAPSPAAATAPVRALSEAQQVGKAMQAVFGKPSPVMQNTGDGRATTRAGKLLWQGDRAVLITATSIEQASHAVTGSLGVYYLRPSGDHFDVSGRFPAAVSGNGFGGEPNNWSISERFGALPVIYAEAGWTGQGMTCSSFTLTELAPNKPVQLASVPIGYDDSGAGGESNIEGKLGTIVPGKSFTVDYSGSEQFSETWTRKGDAYALPAETKVPSC